MAITAYFTPTGMNADTYQQALDKLEAAGAGAPAPGRVGH